MKLTNVATCLVLGTLGVQSAQAVVVTITAQRDNPTFEPLVVFDSGGLEDAAAGNGVPNQVTTGTWVGATGTDPGRYGVVEGAFTGGPAAANEGGKYLVVDRRTSAGAIINASFSRDIVRADESFKIEFSMWMGSDPSSPADYVTNPQAYFFAQSDAAGTGSPTYGTILSGFGMRFNNNGSDSVPDGTPELMRYRTSSGTSLTTSSIASPPTWTPNAWNDVTLEWNYETSEALLTVGSQGSTDVVFRLANGSIPGDLPTSIGQFQFRANSTESVFFVDDIAAAVPEPASLGSLAIASGLLLARRRKVAVA